MKKVAIITRTKDRPILLERAFLSVKNQTYTDYVWMVINDGGNKKDVDKVVNKAKDQKLDVRVIHNEISLGMEAASNIGIHNSDSEYVVIHDDDDSWEESFLHEVILCFSENEKVSDLAGVITQVNKIEEFFVGDEISILSRKKYNKDLLAVTLTDVASLHLNPPPISFVYRRSVFSNIGFYDENLPVLGDWDFLLRFLMCYTVGIVEAPLANYHIRLESQQGEYGNTILAKKHIHKLWESKVIDKYLKIDLQEKKIGLGFFLYQNKQFRNLDYQMYLVRTLSNLIRYLKEKIYYIFYKVKKYLK